MDEIIYLLVTLRRDFSSSRQVYVLKYYILNIHNNNHKYPFKNAYKQSKI